MDILTIANKIGLSEKDIVRYGEEMAKIRLESLPPHRGKLILTTAITPTKAGEGKTTTVIGLADGLALLGKRTIAALREPSMGPVFGVKGGGTGGGEEILVPEEDINLHFTGDLHALTSVNNLIAAALDNEIYQKTALDVDPDTVVFPRAMDMNDRSLRHIETCLNPKDGPRHEGTFVITAASEIMAIYCLARDREDFLDRVEDIALAKDRSGRTIRVRDLSIRGAIFKLMRHAFLPNLVRTKHGTPAIVQGGPFANIAHGANAIQATKTALALSDYVVTEAGFGSDLGMEKYLDIVSPIQGFGPDMIVLVATCRALKLHGGVPFADLDREDLPALEKGFANLLFHFRNAAQYGVPVLTAINVFPQDTPKEIALLERLLKEHDIAFAANSAYFDGPKGAIALAQKTLDILSKSTACARSILDKDMDVFTKIETIAKKTYGADGVVYDEAVRERLSALDERERTFFVCISKTPNSISDDAHLLNVPRHTLHVKGLRIFDGAGFIVPLTGSIVTMPGLPKVPLAKGMKEE